MDILNGKVRTLYLRLLGAAVGSALVSSIFSMVDAMMVGQYHGPEGTAALAVFSPIWNIVYSLGILAGIGGSVLFANARGRQNEQEANEYFTVSVVFGAVLAILAMAGIGLFSDPLFRLFGAKGDDRLVYLATEYLKPIWFAIPCCVFSNIQAAYLRNDGNAGLAMKAVLFGGLFNVAGDYFFVFALDMGIFGAGLATTIGLYASNLLMLTHFFSKKNTLRLVQVTSVRYKTVKTSLAGFSTAINDLAMGVITILLNNQIMRLLGTDALAVYGIIAQIVPFAQCCAYGAGQAAQPILSQNLGAGQNTRIRECLRYSLMTCGAFGILWLAATELFPTAFVHFFMEPTPEVLAIAPGIIRSYCSSFLLLPFNIFATYYFQALLRPNAAMVASLGRAIVISGGTILILPLLFGAHTLWFAMLVTEILVAAYSLWQMIQCTKSLKD